jgi:PAS domain S-box-containing protein
MSRINKPEHFLQVFAALFSPLQGGGMKAQPAPSSLIVLAALTLFFATTTADAQSRANTSPEKIILQLKWRHQFQFAGYYAAVEKGFYRNAGLEVVLHEGAPEINPSDEVLAGRAQYGISDPVLIIERNQGRPLVVLAAVFQHSPLAFFSLKQSGISSPQDLMGRRIWMRPVLEAGLVVMLRNEGVSLDKITIVPTLHGISDLIEGRVDAIAGYVTDRPFELEKRKLAYCTILPQTYGIDFYGDCLFSSEQELQKNPERVRAFLSATLQGWEYAMKHHEEMAEIILAKYHARMTLDQLLFEAGAMEKLILPEFIELGHMNPGRWRHIGDVYVKAGMLKTGYSIEGLIYDPKTDRYSTIFRNAAYAAGFIAAFVLLGLCIMLLFNRRLKFSVAQRTAELEHETAERRRAEEQRRKELERSAALISLYEKAAGLSDRELYAYAMDSAVGLTDSAIGFFHLVSADQQNIIFAVWNRATLDTCSTSFEAHYPLAEAGIWVDCVRLKQPVVCNDYANAAHRKGLPEGHVPVHRFMSIPVIVDGRVKIIFGVGNKPTDYDEQDILHIQFIANELQKILLQRIAEAALRESEERFRKLAESAPIAIMIYQNDRWIYVNPAGESMCGYTAEELYTMQPWAFVHPDYQELVRSRALERMQGKPVISRYEIKILTKTGAVGWVDFTGALIEYNGAPAGIIAVIDITERKRMEQALEQRIIALTRPLDESADFDFELLFNLEEIQKLQDTFALATGVASIITHVDGTPITQPSSFCRLCSDIIRKTEEGLKNCYCSDAVIGRHHPDGPIVQPCLSGGLWDAGASITVGGRHIANWLIGQVRNEAQDEARMRQYAREIGADESAFIQAFYEVPAMPREKFNQIAQALHTLAGQLSSLAYQNIQQARFISDLTSAEKSLQESREELLNIIDNSVDGIYFFDENGAIVEWNQGCEQITGLSQAETLGRRAWDVYYDLLPDDAKKPELREQLILLTRECLRPGARPNSISELTIQCPDGTRKVVQSTDFLIKGAKGYLRCVISRDVTEMRRAAQEQLRLATALEQADEAVVMTDPDGAIQFVNPAFERITGYARQEAVGQNPRFLKSGRQTKAFYRELWDTISGGRTWKGHLINKRKDGSLFEEEATISPVKSAQGDIINYVAVKRDVTQQLQLEDQVRQTQKLEAIGTLAGGIAHDFNNILGGIMGYSELALSQLPDTDGRQIKMYLREALNSAERAKSLVKQILTFSRKVDQERKPVQVGLVVKEVCKLLRASLPATIELRQSLKDLEALVMGDPTQIYQIVMNLSTNAHHAMRETGGVLEIGLCKVDLGYDSLLLYPELQQGTYLKLTVSDTGCGIKQEHLKNIFDPYFTTKEKGEGTGLGLAVVDGIVKSHGGEIKVFSTEGEGTTFEVLFPVLLPTESAAAEIAGEAPPAHGKETILFVDDEEKLRDIGSRLLELLGYRVVLAADAREALEKFASMPDDINLVITDKTMPRITGFELAKGIKELRPDTPIVLCTGYGETEDMARAEAIGICQFVMKPLRLQTLAETVRRALDKTGACPPG